MTKAGLLAKSILSGLLSDEFLKYNRGRFNLIQPMAKEVSPEVKRERRIRKREKKQQKNIRQEALHRSHDLLIERRKMAKFKKKNGVKKCLLSLE